MGTIRLGRLRARIRDSRRGRRVRAAWRHGPASRRWDRTGCPLRSQTRPGDLIGALARSSTARRRPDEGEFVTSMAITTLTRPDSATVRAHHRSARPARSRGAEETSKLSRGRAPGSVSGAGVSGSATATLATRRCGSALLRAFRGRSTATSPSDTTSAPRWPTPSTTSGARCARSSRPAACKHYSKLSAYGAGWTDFGGRRRAEPQLAVAVRRRPRGRARSHIAAAISIRNSLRATE